MGTLTLHADGTFTYTPDTHYVGSDSFTYTFSDPLGPGNTATVWIDVYNNAPYAMEGEVRVVHDRVEVLAISAYDPDLEPVVISAINGNPVQPGQQISLPSGARITIYEDGYFEYIPRTLWVGIEQFSYRVSDNVSESEEAIFRIHVVNTAPLAHDASFTVSREEPTGLQLINLNPDFEPGWGAYDLDRDTVTLEITQQPQHGTLRNYGSYLVYEPNTENIWLGSDWFRYRAFDGIGYSDEKTVWLHPDQTVAAPGLPQLQIVAYRPLSNSNGMYKFIGMTPVPVGKTAYIRWNNDDDDHDIIDDRWDNDVKDEDDLIPIDLHFGTDAPGNLLFRISKNNNNLRVWTTGPAKLPGPGGGQLILSDSLQDNAVPFPQNPNGGGGTLRLWVEWIVAPDQAANGNETTITFQAIDKTSNQVVASAEQKFSGHQAIVIVFGGSGQCPTDMKTNLNNYGTYVLAQKLYEQGYDVHAFCPNPGIDPAFKELKSAINKRGVQDVAIFGYSSGGGRTYELAEKLDDVKSNNQFYPFEIKYTGYIDAFRRGGVAEDRRPPQTAFHYNVYQQRRLPEGQPTKNAQEGDEEYNATDVEDITHFNIDDKGGVHLLIETKVKTRMPRK